MIVVRRSLNRLAHRNRLLLASAIAVAAITALSLTIPSNASATSRQSAATASKRPPAAVTPPPLTLQDIAQNLGATTYQDTYGGMTVSPTAQEIDVPSHITIYVVATAPDATRFLSAIQRAAATPGGRSTSYSIVDVRHSFAQLYSLTMKIAQQRDTWRNRGINLQMWGPDPSTNKVAITLATYTAAAARSLNASYGTNWMSVSTKPLNMGTLQLGSRANAPQASRANAPQASRANAPQASVTPGRFQDSNPFYGGDYINNPGENAACTDGFVMLGASNPDNHWLMTAGHCRSMDIWYTNITQMYTLGSTATNYFQNFGGNTKFDVQTIRLQTPFTAYGQIWGNGTMTYEPYTTLTAGAGQEISFDGALTGEVHQITVDTAGPVCLGAGNNEVCGVGVAGSVTGPRICQEADSGGPVFQRVQVEGPVQAVGLITSSNTTYNVCIYTLLNAIMGPTDTRLDTLIAG